MTISLDLTESRAKLARADVHLETIEAEVPKVLNQRHPYTPVISEINENGWCSAALRPSGSSETSLAVVVGDFIHNLRCALDYIVSSLAAASGVTVATCHQFPIYEKRAAYDSKVGTLAVGKSRGPLSKIKYGVTLVRELQPFTGSGDPHADMLFHIQRLSNADKHRELMAPLFEPVGGQVTFTFNGVLLDRLDLSPAQVLPNGDMQFARLRFAKPYPPEVQMAAEVGVAVAFGARPFGEWAKGHAVGVELLRSIRNHVVMIIDLFEKL